LVFKKRQKQKKKLDSNGDFSHARGLFAKSRARFGNRQSVFPRTDPEGSLLLLEGVFSENPGYYFQYITKKEHEEDIIQ
jgi:hypothetical protein